MNSVNIVLGAGAYAADPSADYNIALGAGACANGGRKGCYAHGAGCCTIGGRVLTYDQALELVKGNRAAEAYMRGAGSGGSAGMVSVGGRTSETVYDDNPTVYEDYPRNTVHVSGGNGVKVTVTPGGSCFVSTGRNSKMYVDSRMCEGNQYPPHAQPSVAANKIANAATVGGVYTSYPCHNHRVGGVYDGEPANPPVGSGATITPVNPSDPNPPEGDFVADTIIF